MVRPRLRSWWWDYLVVVAWLLVVLLLVGVPTLRGWIDLSAVWSRPVAADGAVALLTVVPFLAYLVVAESGPTHATLGKRRSGLAVRDAGGTPPAAHRVVVRNVVKVLPWQFGHMAATRFAAGDPSSAAIIFYVVSVGLLILDAAPPLVGRRGLHDSIAGTVVVPVRPSAGGSPDSGAARAV